MIPTRILNSNDFRTSKMRGLNLSLVNTASDLKAKNLPAARATGANHGRYWLSIAHDANDNYFFSDRHGVALGDVPLQTLDAAIVIARDAGMYLIPTLNVLPNQGNCDLWGHPKRKDGVIKIWQQLATRYKGEPVIAAYDLINEPRLNTPAAADSPEKGSVKEYIDWQIQTVKAIRAIDPDHVIVIEVLKNQWLADAYMSNIVKMPNLVYSPHGYSYGEITHQGIPNNKVRFIFPSTQHTVTKTIYSNDYWYEPVNFAKKYNVPLWIGEFACINWAAKNDNNQWTSTRWMEEAIKFMEYYGIGWAAHAWREYEGWDVEIPSSFYVGMPYKDAAPYPLPSGSTWRSQRSSTAPTITMLRKYFTKNQPFV